MGDAIVWSASITSKAAGWWRIDQMKSFGNLILMTLICVVVFIVFMAVRPTKASAHNFQREAELSDLARPYYPATVLDLISPEAVTCS
jgi:hypothetical protein